MPFWGVLENCRFFKGCTQIFWSLTPDLDRSRQGLFESGVKLLFLLVHDKVNQDCSTPTMVN